VSAALPLCGHDLIRLDRGKPIIDAGAVDGFAAFLQQRYRQVDGSPLWPELVCREQAWLQAHDQLDAIRHADEDLNRWIGLAKREAEAVRGAWVCGTEAEREQEGAALRTIARYRRALAFRARMRWLQQEAA
jgi:hypothetical protein